LDYSKNNGFEKGKVEIKRNCKDPQVKVELKNENGEILDSKVFSFNSNEEIIKNYNIKLFKNILYIFIGVLVVGGILFYFIKIKNKKNEENTK
jgi:hypothetical protein